MTLCLKLIVRGRVQGVGYRNSIYRKVSDRLPAVQGFVRNLSNGDVEIIVSGESKDLKQVTAFAYEGSALSKVEGIEVIELHTSGLDLPSTFSIR